MGLPNWITIARIGMVPIFLVLAYGKSSGAAVGAFALFIVASISDLIDGYLARRNGVESRLGQFLDPTADKLLIGAALLVLVDTRTFPLWAALVIAAREIAVQILRTRIVSGGGTLPASLAGKFKTVVQMGMVGWWLLPWDGRGWPHWAWLGAALTATVWSGLDYFMRGTHREAYV